MGFEIKSSNVIHCTKKGLCSSAKFPKEMQFMRYIWVFGTMLKDGVTAVYFKKGYFD